MKKELTGFIAGCAFTAAALLGVPALADAYNQNINVDINKVSVVAEQQKMTGDTILWNNKTYIPMRETLEKANCTVNYHEDTNTVVVLNKFHRNVSVFAINGLPIPQTYGAIYVDNTYDANTGIHYYIDMNYFVDSGFYQKQIYNYNGMTIMNFVSQ